MEKHTLTMVYNTQTIFQEFQSIILHLSTLSVEQKNCAVQQLLETMKIHL